MPRIWFEQAVDDVLCWAENIIRDGTERDDWLLEYRIGSEDALWSLYFNGPKGWKNIGKRRLRNWEMAY